MLRAGAGISTALDPTAAGRGAAEEALRAAGAEAADCAVLLGTAAHGAALEGAVAAAAERLGTHAVVGGAVDALFAGDRFVEGNPGVAVLALAGCGPGLDGEDAPGARGGGFLLRDLAGAEERAGEEVLAHVAQPGELPGAGDLLLLFADSRALLAQPLLASIAEALAPASVVGLGASPIPGARPLVWGGAEVAGAALAGLFVRGAGPAWLGVGNACRPLSGELRVTRARGHWVLGLDGRPALDLYREIAGEPAGEERPSGAQGLLAAIAVDEARGPGDADRGAGFLASGAFRLRDIVGIDPERRAFSVPEPMASGRTLAFVRSDPEGARADLAAQLTPDVWRDALFGLHFARRSGGPLAQFGTSLAGQVASRVPPAPRMDGLPLIGGAGAYQIGPVQGRAGAGACELLSHAEILVLFRG